MYDRLKNDHEEGLPDENKGKPAGDDDKESASLSAAASPGSYGSTPVQEKSDARSYVPRCGLILYFMTFFGIFCAFAMRAALSEAIVAMENDTAIVENGVSTNASSDDQCPRDEEEETKLSEGELIWTREQQAIVLAAFYYGHFFALIPGGWLTDKFGGRWFFGGCILLSSVVALLTPSAARTHISLLIILRILSGIGEGALFPSAQSLLARWSPPKYVSAIVGTIIASGNDGGTVVGMLLSGVLSDYGFAGGWPSIFYVFGTVGCLCSIACFLLLYDSPFTHPWISTVERQYWEREIGAADLAAHPPTPWKNFLTSVPVWALTVAFFTDNWGFYTLTLCIPLYIHDVLGFSMLMNGIITAIPFVVSTALAPVSGILADWLRAPGRLSTNVVRKTLIVIGFTVSGCSFALITYTGCVRALAVLVIVLAAAGSGISYANVLTNIQDLAPLHAGKLMGLTYTAVALGAIGAPSVVGAVTDQQSTREQWRIMFFLTAAIYVVGGAVFVAFGSVDRQSWAEAIKDDYEMKLQSTESQPSENHG